MTVCRLLGLSLLVTSLVVAVGCAREETVTHEKGTVELVFAHFKVPSPEALTGLIEAFEQQNPGSRSSRRCSPPRRTSSISST
ncbi:MAG: hypothetical protein M5R38_05130 [Candidatus Methylomirabilis sp.]|nr:hypothetical protein [Candidatus Methylomirabilis sp.]